MLYWPGARSDDSTFVDQVAVASESLDIKVPKNESHEIAGSLSSSERDDIVISFENSNGFVPMTSSTEPTEEKYSSAEPTTKEPFRINVANYSEPDFSTEARILMNLQGSTTNRRSYDVDNDEKEFEILKVNSKTPAVANYNEFYETFQKNKDSKAAKSPTKNFSYFRQKERMKQINDYISYQDGNSQQHHSLIHHDSQDTPKKTYELEKVHNYPSAASDYDIFSESVTRQRSSNLPPSGYDLENTRSSWKPASPKYQNNRNTKSPPIVVDSNEHSYTQQYVTKTPQPTSTEPSFKYQTDMSEDRYDRNEDYSEENTDDYYEITERPRRLHKSRRKPYEASRKLPKEHRGDSSESKKQTSTRTKLNRGKPKQNYWSEEQPSQESSEENTKEERTKDDKASWSQVGPNVEFSQSNGYEVGQIDKPNVLVPVNLNLVPLSNFDHATALGNSQGFDMTNVGMPGYVSSGSIVSTAAPLLSSVQPVAVQNLPQGVKHQNIGYSTAVPDIVVGQNSFHNPVQTVLVQQPVHNKYTPSIKNYYPSTATPMFTMTPTLQGFSTIQSTVASKSVTPNMQLFYPQSTISTAQPLYQTPSHANYNIVVNPNGLNGQNVQHTTPSYNYGAQSDSQKKNNQFLASASYSVGNGGQQAQNNQQNQAQSNNPNNNRYASSQINAQVVKPQMLHGYIQAGSGIPVNFNQQQFTNVGNNILENTWKQLQQLQGNGQQNLYHRIHYHTAYGKDNAVSPSNTNVNTVNAIQVPLVKAQLPVVGTQHVEIVNPNFQAVNPIQVNPFSGAVVTTQIPIYSTPAGLVTPTAGPIAIQNYVDSLTQIGAQQTVQQENGAMYNPMNFIPNMEVVKSQTMLNGKNAESLPPNLSLVPMIPGGKFSKHSHEAQAELITKPKLSSDLEKYANEMFKESLRTIYNTHKWNSDKRVRNLTSIDSNDLERLRQELERYRAVKPGKEILEAHHSEAHYHTADPGHGRRPGLTITDIEELFKTDFKPQSFSGDSLSSASKPSLNNVKLSDYLTPPKVNSFVSKSPFVDSKPAKKRPSKRPHSRPSSRPGNLDTSASNHVSHSYRRPHYGRGSYHGDYRGAGTYLDNYPSLTTSSPDLDFLQFRNDNYMDYNHPRMHNLMGLLMKSKQLPSGTTSSSIDDDSYSQFISYDQRRMYNEAMKHNNQITSASYHSLPRLNYHYQ